MNELELTEPQLQFAQALLQTNLISIDHFEAWLGQQTEPVYDLAEQLTFEGIVDEFKMVQQIGKLCQFPIANEIELEMDATAHPAFDRELCVDFIFIPLSEDIKKPFPIAMANPFDEEVITYLESLIDTPIQVYLAAPSHLRKELFACYGTEEEWIEFLKSNDSHPPEDSDRSRSSSSPPLNPDSVADSPTDLPTTPSPSDSLNDQYHSTSSSQTLTLSHIIPNWSHTQRISIDHFRKGRF